MHANPLYVLDADNNARPVSWSEYDLWEETLPKDERSALGRRLRFDEVGGVSIVTLFVCTPTGFYGRKPQLWITLAVGGGVFEEMRHSNISLTMGTYTDARLLDTAEAVESLSLLIGPEPRTVAPVVAPNSGQEGHIQSISDQTCDVHEAAPGTKKPDKTLGLPGLSEWALRDSNPRPSRCKRDALAN